jgi:hypothetical protein
MSPIDMTKRHYEALGSRTREEGHPVDRLVYALPEVARIDRAVRELTTRIGGAAGLAQSGRWRQMLDLRVTQLCAHKERYFDVGYELGRLAGLGEAARPSAPPEVQDLARLLREAVALSPVPHDLAAVALLEIARGLMLRSRHQTGGAA